MEILYRLQGLYQFYKSAHWLASGETFYEDHLLFAKLYEGMDEEMDVLVELILSTQDVKKELNPLVILKESSKYVPEFGTSAENMVMAVKMEEELLAEIQKIRADEVAVGLYNHIASIAQAHTRNGYLLHRSLI